MNPPAPQSAHSFSRERRFYFGLNVLLALFLAVSVMVMINYLGARHSVRWFWSHHNQFTLSSQTRQVLQSLTNTTEVVVFFDPDHVLFEPITRMLQEYARVNPRLRVRHVDYYRNPGEANLFKEKYSLSFPVVKDEVYFKNLILFDCQGRVKTVLEKQLSDYDFSGLMSRKSNEIKRTAFLGEILFTSALISVMDTTSSKAFFLKGHRELSPTVEEDWSGYSHFAGYLRHNNVQTDTLQLREGVDLITQCQLLVIAGARDRLLSEELDQIEQYLRQGGRLLVMLQPLARTGLETVLARWGVEVGENLVFDEAHTYTKDDLITTNFLSHPITRPLGGSTLHIPSPPCTVASLARGNTDAEAAKAEVLVETSPTGVAVTTIRDGVPYRTPNDRQGNLPLAVGVEKGGLQGVNASRGTTRIVVVGDCRMLANKGIDSAANMDFAAQSVNWLLDRPQFMGGINPRPFKDYQLVLSRSQVILLRWVLLAALPGGILLLGLLIWLRRRL
jgi:ABC-type uncharacterized transport system involved in gliding motility auxiliary subunit